MCGHEPDFCSATRLKGGLFSEYFSPFTSPSCLMHTIKQGDSAIGKSPIIYFIAWHGGGGCAGAPGAHVGSW